MVELMSNIKRVGIVGCGAFGAMIALRLAENGYNVTVFESKKECLQGASLNNQNRLHLGFHYPRDLETAKQCIKGFSRFCKEFSECIVSKFPNLYFIAKENSYTSEDEYVNFCSQLGIYSEIIPLDKIPVQVENVSQAILCKEVVYDCNILRKLIMDKINLSGVKLLTDTKVIKIQSHNEEYELTCSENNNYYFDHVINCTYADMNRLTSQLGHNLNILQYEYTMIPIIQSSIPKTGLTIMDGPFMTLLPYGNSNDYLLYHVDHSVIARSNSTNLDSSWLNVDSSPIHDMDIKAHFNKMLVSCSYYVPELLNSNMSGYLQSPRVVMANSDKTDARPSIINTYGKSYHTVFSGKIDHCVWVADDLLGRISK